MTLVDLLSRIDPSRLRVQVLGQVLVGKQMVAKDGTTQLRFATDEALDGIVVGSRNALIIWGDNADFERARVEARAALDAALPPQSAVEGPSNPHGIDP
jgi:hypothetical protein